MTTRRLAGLMASGALLILIVAVLTWPAPDAERSEGTARSSTRGADGEGRSDGEEGAAEARGAAETVDGAPAAGAKVGFASPEEAEDFVDRNVTEWLAVVAPEIDPLDVDRTCTRDGLHCTFTGPWPGNDLLARLIRAQGSGSATRGDLEGVTFSRLRPEDDEAGQRIFVLEAHAPGGR